MTPPSSADGTLITIMPGPRMKGIASCDADDRGSERDTWGHDGEDCSRDRGEVIGSDVDEPHCPHPRYASISFPGGIGVEVNIIWRIHLCGSFFWIYAR